LETKPRPQKLANFVDRLTSVLAIIELVKSGCGGEDDKPFRPLKEDALTQGSHEHVRQCLMLVMTECWAEDEDSRPSFDTCLDLIFRLTGDKYVPLLHSVTTTHTTTTTDE